VRWRRETLCRLTRTNMCSMRIKGRPTPGSVASWRASRRVWRPLPPTSPRTQPGRRAAPLSSAGMPAFASRPRISTPTLPAPRWPPPRRWPDDTAARPATCSHQSLTSTSTPESPVAGSSAGSTTPATSTSLFASRVQCCRADTVTPSCSTRNYPQSPASPSNESRMNRKRRMLQVSPILSAGPHPT
jgi:hypothetical protein